MAKTMHSFRLSDDTWKYINFLYRNSGCYTRTQVVEQCVKDMYERLKNDFLL